MTKLNSFDRATVKALREEIDLALGAVAEKHGISLSIGTISFSAEKFTARLTAQTLGSSVGDEMVNTDSAPFGRDHRWTRAWQQHAAQFGLKPDDLGREIVFRGKRFRLGGITTNSPRGNIVLATIATKPRYLIVTHTEALAALN